MFGAFFKNRKVFQSYLVAQSNSAPFFDLGLVLHVFDSFLFVPRDGPGNYLHDAVS